jgi:hypothetical protein
VTIYKTGFRTLSFLWSKFVRRLHLPVRQHEQERRVLQEGLESAQHSIDQTLTLINEAQAARTKAHVRTMLFQVTAHALKPSQKAA